MKAHELRNMERGELLHKLDELYQELFNLRFQAATRQLSDANRIGQVRRDIARAKTVLHELDMMAEVL